MNLCHSVLIGIFLLFSSFGGGYIQAEEAGAEWVIDPHDSTTFSINSLAAAAAAPNPDVAPSVTSSTLGAGINTVTRTGRCTRQWSVVTDCVVNIIDISVVPNSGGHDHHSSGRPTGTVTPMILNPDASGTHTFTFEAPEESGTIEITGVGTSPSYPGETFRGVLTINVGIGGLVSLPSGSEYTLIGQTATHADNHYGKPRMISSLQSVAGAFFQATGSMLALNDMSLVSGGLFDYQANWSRPHASHRFGLDADIRLVSPQDRPLLRNIFQSHSYMVIVEGNHWHVRLP